MQALEGELDVMAALKTATTDQHRSIERITPFFAEDFSLHSYCVILRIFWGFYEPVETRLASIPGWDLISIDIEQRRRAPLLRKDLLALGMPPSDFGCLPRCEDLPALTSLDDGIGCLYVLEGSTLGGQLIARQVANRFGLNKDNGSAFFEGYGERTGTMWMQFCSSVRLHDEGTFSRGARLAAAKRTFASMEAWMRKAGLHE